MDPVVNGGASARIRSPGSGGGEAPQPEGVTNFVKALAAAGLNARVARSWWRWLGQVYRDIDWNTKRVLDLGAGTGYHTAFAAASRASVVCAVEPELSGASTGACSTLARLTAECNQFARVIVVTSEIAGARHEGPFDIVLCFNVINHVHEDLVPRLPTDPVAVARYSDFFQELYASMSDGGKLILADCSPENHIRGVSELLGIRHPVAPTIQWHLHQPPEVWAAMAVRAGMRLNSLRWPAPRQLSAISRLVSNRSASGFLQSHFVLVLEKAAVHTVLRTGS